MLFNTESQKKLVQTVDALIPNIEQFLTYYKHMRQHGDSQYALLAFQEMVEKTLPVKKDLDNYTAEYDHG